MILKWSIDVNNRISNLDLDLVSRMRDSWIFLEILEITWASEWNTINSLRLNRHTCSLITCDNSSLFFNMRLCHCYDFGTKKVDIQIYVKLCWFGNTRLVVLWILAQEKVPRPMKIEHIKWWHELVISFGWRNFVVLVTVIPNASIKYGCNT